MEEIECYSPLFECPFRNRNSLSQRVMGVVVWRLLQLPLLQLLVLSDREIDISQSV